MPTPDFEEWLARQEIDVIYKTDIEKWQQYMVEELGLSKGTLDVTAQYFVSNFEVLPEADITPFWRHYTVMGETFAEIRYAIKGMPGSFGAERAYTIAVERLTAAGETTLAEIAQARLDELIAGE